MSRSYEYQPSEDVRLHRGIAGPSIGAVRHPLGIHWSTDPQIAENFAVFKHPDGDVGTAPYSHGVVYSADVPPNELLENDRDPEFVSYVKGQRAIYGSDHPEKERTVLNSLANVRNLSAVQYDNGRLTRGTFFGDTRLDKVKND